MRAYSNYLPEIDNHQQKIQDMWGDGRTMYARVFKHELCLEDNLYR